MAKRIVMEELFGKSGLLDSSKTTLFKVSLETGAKCNGEAVWLQSRLPEWETLLNEQSGAKVTHSELLGKREPYSLVLDMVIPGGFNRDIFTDQDVKTVFSGQIKKILAMKILKDFPPPFDVYNPMFSPDIEDQIFIHNTRNFDFWRKGEIDMFQKLMITPEFNGLFDSKAEWGGIDIPSRKEDRYVVMHFRWKAAVTLGQRFDFCHKAERFFCDNNLKVWFLLEEE